MVISLTARRIYTRAKRPWAASYEGQLKASIYNYAAFAFFVNLRDGRLYRPRALNLEIRHCLTGRFMKWPILMIKINISQTRGTLDDIATLDRASETATNRLTIIRARSLAPRQEEQILEGHIHEIEKEKRNLTINLPTLIRYGDRSTETRIGIS